MTSVQRVGRLGVGGGQNEVVKEEAREETKEEVKPYQPLKILGGIREKGFDADSLSSGGKHGRISLPQPSVRPFPVARHRSEGPVSKLRPVGLIRCNLGFRF